MGKVKPVVDTPSQVRLLNNLRVLMAAAKNAGRTQGSIAQAAGLHQSYLSLVLRGRRSITLDVIEALAPVLGSTAEAVLQRDFPDPASVSNDPLSSPTFILDANVLELIRRILRPMFSEADLRAFDLLNRSLPKTLASAKTPAHSGHRLPKVIDTPTEQVSRS